MSDVKGFFQEIDRLWTPTGTEKIPLRVIGSGALLLQTDYVRGTKDGDVLESLALTEEIKVKLLKLAGEDSPLSERTRLYLDIVVSGLPFLPAGAKFHTQTELNKSLRHFEIHVLDIVDVVVSKLKRFNKYDQQDVKAMIDRRLVPHKSLIERFNAAVDRFSTDSRAEDLPRSIKNLNLVERDYLAVPESKIDLPDWMDR